MARGSGSTRSEVGRVFKLLRRSGEIGVPTIGARAFLARYAEELALSQSVRSNVEEMLEEVDQSPEVSGTLGARPRRCPDLPRFRAIR